VTQIQEKPKNDDGETIAIIQADSLTK
jgi:hypothetical protein